MKIATIVAALAALLIGASSAEATIYKGAVNDSATDLGLYGGDALADPPTNFTRAEVRYDDTAGRIDVRYEFSNAPAVYQEVRAGIGLGITQANGQCSAPYFISIGWHPSSSYGGYGETFVEGESFRFAGRFAAGSSITTRRAGSRRRRTSGRASIRRGRSRRITSG